MGEQAIHVKGRSPQYTYAYSLPKVFDSFGHQQFSVEECVSFIESEGSSLDKNSLLQSLFSYRLGQDQSSEGLPFSFAGPFQMKSVLDSLFQFNLRYQDSVIKIELEKAEEAANESRTENERNETLIRILRTVSVVLRTMFFSRSPLYLDLTNMELDNIVLQCLSLLSLSQQDDYSPKVLLEIGKNANRISKLTQRRILSDKDERLKLADILPLTLYSGVVWWSDIKTQRQFATDPDSTIHQLAQDLSNLTKNALAINDFDLFWIEVVKTEARVRILWFLDDNGEMMWNLLFIRLLLGINPHLVINCVVNKIPITNNVTGTTLLHGLQDGDGEFCRLLENDQFNILEEPSRLPAIDLRFVSTQLKEHILEADIFVVNGVSFFEKLQYLPAPTYYMFTVYSNTSTILTGLQRYKGVFARVGPHLCCFSHIEGSDAVATPGMNLRGLHSALQMPQYKRFVEQFDNEGEANLFLRSKAHQENITLEAAILQV